MRAAGTDGEGFVQFRDVFEVDGGAVRDRSERLVKLFMNPSAAAKNRAAEIMRESARYNIGSIERNINVPVLALSFMHPRYQPRFKFTMDDAGARRAEGDAESVELHDRGRRARAEFPRGGIAAADRLARPEGRRAIAGACLGGAGDGPGVNDRDHDRDTDGREHHAGQLPVRAAAGFLVPVEMREEYVIRKRNYLSPGRLRTAISGSSPSGRTRPSSPRKKRPRRGAAL